MEILFFKKNDLNHPNKQDELLPDNTSCIDEVCELVSNEESLYTIFKRINADGRLKKDSSSLYTFQDYNLYFGAFYNLQNTSENLKKISHLDLPFAPKLIKTACSSNKMYQLLVVKLPQNLIPYDKQKTKLSFCQKTDFIRNIQQLSANLNLYNPCFFDENFWFLDNTGNIFIQDWSQLIKFKNENEKQKYIQDLSKKLGLMYY